MTSAPTCANFQDFIIRQIDTVRHLDHCRFATDPDNATNHPSIVPSEQYGVIGRNGDGITDFDSHCQFSLCARRLGYTFHIGLQAKNTSSYAGITRISPSLLCVERAMTRAGLGTSAGYLG
jgi:hypothetical protein